jgi:hypothetical protein
MSKNNEKLKMNKRTNIILEEINKVITLTDLDPILIAFKNNEILKEFFMKRFFEIIQVKFIYSGNPR